jgi:hypothetical protein
MKFIRRCIIIRMIKSRKLRWVGHVTCMDKGKVKLSLCLIMHHTSKTYGGVDIQLHAFLIPALDGSEWSASRLGLL